MDDKCPECGKQLSKLSDRHYHCSCGVCLYKGLQLKWFSRGEEEDCPGWKKDPFIRTSGLA